MHLRVFFLTSLGSVFLKMYYKSVSNSSTGILLGCYNDKEELCGFCAATTMSNGFNKRLIKENIMKYIFIAIYLLFSRPLSLLRLKNNLIKTNSEINDTADYAELLSIAVSVNSQRQGVGEKLLLQLEEELIQSNCSELSLTTDYYNNEKTIAFYEKIGYISLYEFIAYPNRKMFRMIKNLNKT